MYELTIEVAGMPSVTAYVAQLRDATRLVALTAAASGCRTVIRYPDGRVSEWETAPGCVFDGGEPVLLRQRS